MEEINVEKKFICEICEKIFSTEYLKSKHVNLVHGEQKKIKCNVCIVQQAFWTKKESENSYEFPPLRTKK